MSVSDLFSWKTGWVKNSLPRGLPGTVLPAEGPALAPNNAAMYVARGVGNYYLPAAMGGGPDKAIADFRKAISLDSKDDEAYLWLGVALRKVNKDAEARQAFEKSLQLNPDRVWAKQQLEKTPGR